MGRSLPATDGGAAARRLARRFLGLADNDEALPTGEAARLAAATRWSQSYVSTILSGKRRLTDMMRKKLEKP